MQRYKNLAGNSGAHAYEIGDDFIRVQFTGGDIYRYTVENTGRANIEEMKMRANAGRGPCTFISQVVRDGYAKS